MVALQQTILSTRPRSGRALFSSLRSRILMTLMTVLILIATEAPLAAENRISVELQLFNSISKTGAEQYAYGGAGLATLRIEQLGNRSVRSDFELSTVIAPDLPLPPSINTAYAKFRFDSLRGIIGKAPFSWGEGLIFNVADEIFMETTAVNLMQSSFEDATPWISGLTYYLGPFSFVELLVNPGPMTQPENGAPQLEAVEETRLGARFVGKPFGIKVETAYIFDGRNAAAGETALQDGSYFHRAYLSLQGNLWVDWHLSASLELPDQAGGAGGLPDSMWNGLLATGGLYSLIPVGYDDSFGFRFEARLYPAGRWEQDHSTAVPLYAMFHYGELSYDFGGGFSLMMRGLFNPIDGSARLTPGFSWNIFQGFTLLSYLTVQTGANGDSYPWNGGGSENPGLAYQLGSSVTY